jgi:hypothetical protein
MANLETLAILTGHKSISDMSDEELRDHLRQIRCARLIPTMKATPDTQAKKQKSANVSKARTTKSPMDALLRSLSPEALQEMMKMLEEKNEETNRTGR